MNDFIEIEISASLLTVKQNKSEFVAHIAHNGDIKPIRFTGQLCQLGHLLSVAQSFASAKNAPMAYIVEHMPDVKI